MRKISAVVTINNEEKLLPGFLENVSPHVDEVVLVDGGPEGPSSDRTKEIATGFFQGEGKPKLVYEEGRFVTQRGGWDVAQQRNIGIDRSTGDVLMFPSADWRFGGLEHLVGAARESSQLLFFGSVVEFWLDAKHVRIHSLDGVGPLSLSSSIIEALAIHKELKPLMRPEAGMGTKDAAPTEKMFIPQTFKFHLGWIRPFKEQVEKHIRHVRQGHWGETGRRLLDGSERELYKHWINHVLSYPQNLHIAYSGQVPDENIVSMSYTDGRKEVVEEFERKYKTSLFRR